MVRGLYASAMGSLSENGAKRWILIEGNRLVVTAVLIVAFYLLIAGLAAMDVLALADDSALTRMAGGMIAGTFSLITIVLTINQLILSQELGHAGAIREEMESAFSLREEVEEEAHIPVSPKEPTDFLHTIVRTIRERGLHLRELTDGAEDGTDEGDINAFASDVTTAADEMETMLASADIESLARIIDLLERQQSLQLYRARKLYNQHCRTVPDEVESSFDDLLHALRLLVIGQAYFKTIYLQHELARLSRLMLYIGLPAATAAFLTGLLYADLGGSTIPQSVLPVVVPALLACVFSPLALLAAYMIRVATLTQRTASAGTFVSSASFG